MKKVVFISLITVLFIGCSNDKTEINKKSLYDSFFVQLTLENLSDLIAVKETLTQAIGDTIFTIDDNHLLIGMFDSFRAASDRGFELHADNLIDEFEIFHNDSILNHDYYDLFFVGNDLGRPALYRTSLMEVKPNLIWSKWGREIIKLSPAKSRDNYFFTTCLTKGIRGSFPYIWDARLYNFDSKGEDIQLVQEFGRGLTLHSNWESDSTFTTYFTILDSLITSTVIQKIYSYSYAGDRIDTTEQIYELVSDGIPFPRFSQIETISPDHRYKLNVSNDDSVKYINIIDELNGSISRITELHGEITKSQWNETADYLFITEVYDNLSDSTSLLIIDLENQKLQKKITGKGEKNFVIIGNLLIYDDEFGEKSFITMYRYRNGKIYSTLRVPGGCGIFGIPEKGVIN